MSPKITQGQLEGALWAAANALRGPVDAGDYKAYVFPVLFFKWLSDNWDVNHARAVDDWGDDLTPEYERDFQPFQMPDRCRWDDVHNATHNVGAALSDALQRIEQANPDLAGVFGDVDWANKERLPEPALVGLLDAFHSLPLDAAHVDHDALGGAYEYLLREFAEASGKKAGKFFTPRHVVHLLVRILDPRPGESVMDPACGSGGMLVETVRAVAAAGGNADTMRLYGQEINLTTSAIAKMNLYLHDLEDFQIRRGDTFREPRFVAHGALQAFDVVIANPPFSLQNWGAGDWAHDPYGRAGCGVPPAKNGDFAWIQHMLAAMDPDTGRVGVVMPHGVLFRGGKEAAIRRCLVEGDRLEAVVGLANNLFYSTSIPVCLLVWRARKPAERTGRVLFVDASARFAPGRNRNTLSEADVDAIHAAYARGEDTDGDGGLHVRLVDVEEIAGNGFDLNIGRYIRAGRDEEADVEGALAAYRDARAALREAERVLDEKLRAAGFDA